MEITHREHYINNSISFVQKCNQEINNFDGNTSKFLSATVVFLLMLYIGKASIKKKSIELNGQSARKAGTAKVAGFEALPALKPWIPLKLLGNVPQLFPISSIQEKAERWSKEFGDIFTGSAFNQRCVVFNSAPLIQTLMKSSDLGHIIKAPIAYDAMKPFITNGLLVSRGKFWQHQRKIIMKTQSIHNLKAHAEMLNKHAKKFVQDLEQLFQDGEIHAIQESISVSFLGVIIEMIFGENLGESGELRQYRKNISIWEEVLVKKIVNPLLFFKLFWMLYPQAKEHDKAEEELFQFAERRIKNHIEMRKLNKLDNVNFKETDDDKKKARSVLLDELLDAEVDEKQIVDEVNTMLFAGHETAATTMHFLCFALAINPEIQAKARKEVDEIFEDTDALKEGKISYEIAQSNNMKYVERCILETLRLFPPAFAIARKIESPLYIDYKGQTVKLEPETNIIVSPFLLHRREEYFPEPEKFYPDRFLPEEASKRHAYSFIPFSQGPRNCVGQRFVMMKLKIMTAYLLRHFELSSTDKLEDLKLLPYTSLTPSKNFSFYLKRR